MAGAAAATDSAADAGAGAAADAEPATDAAAADAGAAADTGATGEAAAAPGLGWRAAGGGRLAARPLQGLWRRLATPSPLPCHLIGGVLLSEVLPHLIHRIHLGILTTRLDHLPELGVRHQQDVLKFSSFDANDDSRRFTVSRDENPVALRFVKRSTQASFRIAHCQYPHKISPVVFLPLWSTARTITTRSRLSTS